jgi:hypothetical protein
MKTSFIVIIIAVIVLATSLILYQLSKTNIFDEPKVIDPTIIMAPNQDYNKSKEIAIKNIKEAILANASYEELRQIIQNEVDKNNLATFSAIALTNLKEKYEHGEEIDFDITLFGYRDWCIFAKFYLYLQGYEQPIHEEYISHSCPAPSGEPVPRVSFYNKDSLPLFPFCRYSGIHTIWGESFEYGPEKLVEFYCNGKETFVPPQTHKLVIPKGASDLDLKNSPIPTELHVKWGDIVSFENNDDIEIRIIGDSPRHPDPTAVEFYVTLKPGFSEQIKITYDGIHWIRLETSPEEKLIPWLNATIYVD